MRSTRAPERERRSGLPPRPRKPRPAGSGARGFEREASNGGRRARGMKPAGSSATQRRAAEREHPQLREAGAVKRSGEPPRRASEDGASRQTQRREQRSKGGNPERAPAVARVAREAAKSAPLESLLGGASEGAKERGRVWSECEARTLLTQLYIFNDIVAHWVYLLLGITLFNGFIDISKCLDYALIKTIDAH